MFGDPSRVGRHGPVDGQQCDYGIVRPSVVAVVRLMTT